MLDLYYYGHCRSCFVYFHRHKYPLRSIQCDHHLQNNGYQVSRQWPLMDCSTQKRKNAMPGDIIKNVAYSSHGNNTGQLTSATDWRMLPRWDKRKKAKLGDIIKN